MSVEHITFNKKKLPVKLGYYALKMMQKEHGVSMEELQGDMSLYEPLLFFSLERGHQLTKKEFTYKLEDMVDILEDCFFEFVSLIPLFFPDVEKTLGEAGKKKQK